MLRNNAALGERGSVSGANDIALTSSDKTVKSPHGSSFTAVSGEDPAPKQHVWNHPLGSPDAINYRNTQLWQRVRSARVK